MGDSWRGSMVAALVATLGRPAWWSMALAAFLVRGGLVLVVLPIVVLPTPAALATAFAPTIEALAFGGPTLERLGLIGLGVAVAGAVLGAAGLAGAWLDLAQVREAAGDDELQLGWAPVRPSIRDALALRLTAHLPTLVALGYSSFRIVEAAYAELVAPTDTVTPVVVRVVARAPDALALVAVAWLAGETVGALAARRAAGGASLLLSLWQSTRQLATPRGLATLVLTTSIVVGALVPFLLAAGSAWEHLRLVLLGGADPVSVGAALLVLVGAWILGLAIVGTALAWRGAAWTAELATAPGLPPGPRAGTVPEAIAG